MEEAVQLHSELENKGGKAILQIRNPESQEQKNAAVREAVGACVDALQYATEGNLFETPSLEMDIQPSNEYPYGTHIAVLPIEGSTDKSWQLFAALSRELRDPKIGGSAFVEGRTTDEGTQIDTLKYSMPEMNEEQITGAFITVASGALVQTASRS